jgi:phosphoribosylformimino-5-aminoimidazole carboxamide ribotide isomerase
VVVRGVAGKRDEYQPVESCLTSSTDVMDVASAIRSSLSISEFYLADLDAILSDEPNTEIYRRLANSGFALMIDAGLRDVSRAVQLLDAGAASVIAGLETTPGPRHLKELVETVGAEKIVFSLDLKNGAPLGDLEPWQTDDPFEIASRAIDLGVEKLIVLDLKQVGMAAGLATDSLVVRLKTNYPDLEVITGGGVRGLADLKSQQELGVSAVLVASAIHSEVIGRRELGQLQISGGS